MYPRSLLRLATLALAVSPTLGAPSVFAIGEITPLAATEATVLRKPPFLHQPPQCTCWNSRQFAVA